MNHKKHTKISMKDAFELLHVAYVHFVRTIGNELEQLVLGILRLLDKAIKKKEK